MNTFRKLAILPIVLSLSILLTGCSGGGKSSNANKITLYWWRINGDASEETYKDIANAYSANNNVEIKVISKDPRTYEDEVLSALAAHQSVENAPDIISIASDDLPRYVPQLTPAPDNLFDIGVKENKQTGVSATDYVKQNFEPMVSKGSILNNASGEAKLYGLPIVLDSLALYVNRDILTSTANDVQTSSKYTKDKSREELKELAKKIQTVPDTWAGLTEIVPYLTVRDGNNISRSAISLGTSKNIERSYDVLSTIMMQNGTQLTNSNFDAATFNQTQTGATTSSVPGEEALKFYLRFSNPNDPLYTWNSQMPNSVDAFLQGQVAMMPHYASLYVYLINEMPSLKRFIEVAPMPQISTSGSVAGFQNQKVQGRMNVFAVPSAKGDSARQGAAWQFVRYISSREGSRTYLSATKMPSALKDVTGRAKFSTFDEQKSIADTWFKGHKAMQIDQIFIAMIDDAYTGKKSIIDALNTASNSVTTLLQASKSKWSQGT